MVWHMWMTSPCQLSPKSGDARVVSCLVRFVLSIVKSISNQRCAQEFAHVVQAGSNHSATHAPMRCLPTGGFSWLRLPCIQVLGSLADMWSRAELS